MLGIDEIMCMLDWNNSTDEQEKGIILARQIKNFNVFIQPCNKDFNKNVWENCALILSEKTDEELTPYLTELLIWLQDLTWPGAFSIFNRMCAFSNTEAFDSAYNSCILCACALNESVWAENLNSIKVLRNP